MNYFFRAQNNHWELIHPAFLEYERLIGTEYLTCVDDTSQFTFTKDCIIVNPNNPTGLFISRESVLAICKKLYDSGKILFYDESFADFSSHNLSLLTNSDLVDNPNLVVLKSFGKSYGVPGLRLGILASSNLELISNLRNALPIWNISSQAEIFLDLLPKFKKEYQLSIQEIIRLRDLTFRRISSMAPKGLKVYASQANFLMLEFPDSRLIKVFSDLLLHQNLLFKRIEPRRGIKYASLRIAITDSATCQIIIDCLETAISS